MATTWEEIKKLAADFQRAQLTDSIQLLSDRNCIEIVQKLVDLHLIDVIYTCDGKEYLTPKELEKQILEEISANDGRVNVVDIQKSINVDLSHIQKKVNDIVNENGSNLHLILGELIDQKYIENLADTINEKLQEFGEISLGSLAKMYNLPGDFISHLVIDQNLNERIHGVFEKNNNDYIFTQEYLNSQKSLLRGALNALIKPMQLSNLLKICNIKPKLAISLIEKLIHKKEIFGTLNGNKVDSAYFIPNIFIQKQEEYVLKFFAQNSYIEYESLKRLGISNGKDYLKKKFKTETVNITYLNTCAIGESIFDQLDSAIEECLSSKTIFDARPYLPSILDDNDIFMLLQLICKNKSNVNTFLNYVLPSDNIKQLIDSFEKSMKSQAINYCKNSKNLRAKQTILEDAVIKVTSEEKSKSGKKNKSRKKPNNSESIEKIINSESNEFLPITEIENILSSKKDMKEFDHNLFHELANHLYHPLNKRYFEIVQKIQEDELASCVSDRRKDHEKFKDLMENYWIISNVYSKAIDLFDIKDQEVLVKHFLRNIGTESTDAILKIISLEYTLPTISAKPNNDQRFKFVENIPEQKEREIGKKLIMSLTGTSFKDFLSSIQMICSCYSIILKTDIKKEKQEALKLYDGLKNQLRDETDPATCLHIAVTIKLYNLKHCIVCAPGKFVPTIVSYFKKFLKDTDYEIFQELNDMIILKYRNFDQDDLDEKISNLVKQIKNILEN